MKLENKITVCIISLTIVFCSVRISHSLCSLFVERIYFMGHKCNSHAERTSLDETVGTVLYCFVRYTVPHQIQSLSRAVTPTLSAVANLFSLSASEIHVPILSPIRHVFTDNGKGLLVCFSCYLAHPFSIYVGLFDFLKLINNSSILNKANLFGHNYDLN